MQAITTIGLDIAKSAFQVHGVDAAARPGNDVNDPTRTIHVISPPSNGALRYRRLSGVVAGWDLNPLESAAFSQRTPVTEL
jgi:hypothetical protein